MALSDQSLFIEQYCRFRFYSVTGQANPQNGIGADMWFSNLEIAANITEQRRYQPLVFNTAEGYAAYTPNPMPRQFEFNILLAEKITVSKLDWINEFIGAGYRMDFLINSGYYTWDQTVGDLVQVPAPAFFANAVIEYPSATHRQIARGRGLVYNVPQQFIVKESRILTIPRPGIPQPIEIS